MKWYQQAMLDNKDEIMGMVYTSTTMVMDSKGSGKNCECVSVTCVRYKDNPEGDGNICFALNFFDKAPKTESVVVSIDGTGDKQNIFAEVDCGDNFINLYLKHEDEWLKIDYYREVFEEQFVTIMFDDGSYVKFLAPIWEE